MAVTTTVTSESFRVPEMPVLPGGFQPWVIEHHADGDASAGSHLFEFQVPKLVEQFYYWLTGYCVWGETTGSIYGQIRTPDNDWSAWGNNNGSRWCFENFIVDGGSGIQAARLADQPTKLPIFLGRPLTDDSEIAINMASNLGASAGYAVRIWGVRTTRRTWLHPYIAEAARAI